MYREGIRNYIDQNYGKVKNVYNETITMFFIHMVHTAIELVRLRTNLHTTVTISDPFAEFYIGAHNFRGKSNRITKKLW